MCVHPMQLGETLMVDISNVELVDNKSKCEDPNCVDGMVPKICVGEVDEWIQYYPCSSCFGG